MYGGQHGVGGVDAAAGEGLVVDAAVLRHTLLDGALQGWRPAGDERRRRSGEHPGKLHREEPPPARTEQVMDSSKAAGRYRHPLLRAPRRRPPRRALRRRTTRRTSGSASSPNRRHRRGVPGRWSTCHWMSSVPGRAPVFSTRAQNQCETLGCCDRGAMAARITAS